MTTVVAPHISPDPVPTYLLLTAIYTHGPSWPAELDRYGINAVGEAVSREIAAGNLRDGGHLTDLGRKRLIDLRAQHRVGGLSPTLAVGAEHVGR